MDQLHEYIVQYTQRNVFTVCALLWFFSRYWPFVRGIHRWIPRTKPVTRCFDAFFDLRLNKRLSKQSWGWWFETPSCSLWRHRNESCVTDFGMIIWLTWYQLSNPEKYWWFYHINWAITDNIIKTQHKKSQQNHSHIVPNNKLQPIMSEYFVTNRLHNHKRKFGVVYWSRGALYT